METDAMPIDRKSINYFFDFYLAAYMISGQELMHVISGFLPDPLPD